MSTVELTAQTFDQTLTDNDIVLVDWWAEWCGPCKQFAPVYELAASSHADVVFGKVDTESERELAGGANITSIPTVMAFREGILVFAQPGALPAPALESRSPRSRSSTWTTCAQRWPSRRPRSTAPRAAVETRPHQRVHLQLEPVLSDGRAKTATVPPRWTAATANLTRLKARRSPPPCLRPDRGSARGPAAGSAGRSPPLQTFRSPVRGLSRRPPGRPPWPPSSAS